MLLELCELIRDSLERFGKELDLKIEILSCCEIFDDQKVKYSDSKSLTPLLELYLGKVKEGALPKNMSNEEVIEKLQPIQKKIMSRFVGKIIERLGEKEKEFIKQLLPNDQVEFDKLSRKISNQYAPESEKFETSLGFYLKSLLESDFSIYHKPKKDKHMISLYKNLSNLEKIISK